MTVLYVVNGFASPSTMPDWVFLVGQVFLSLAYLSTIIAQSPGLAEMAGAAPTQTGTKVEVTPFEPDSFYLSSGVGIVVLAFWLVVPFLIGYYQLNATNL